MRTPILSRLRDIYFTFVLECLQQFRQILLTPEHRIDFDVIFDVIAHIDAAKFKEW